ncbi:hypothetical protein K466DRAFT_494170, partial [Polyporus arcularius HHB13444]
VGFALVPTDIDISSASVTLNWWAIGCNQPRILPPADWADTASGKALAQLGCGQLPDSFDVWIDSNPYYSWNASNVLQHTDSLTSIRWQFTRRQNRLLQTFDTTHNFTWISVEESLAFRRQHSISAWYPFDKYTITTTLESIEHAKTTRTDQALHVVFTVRRCVGVKLFALTIFLTDYILAAAMVWVAVCAHFGRPLPESVLFLPLTNILLLPQLRASMPGVPDFGIFMDLFGYYVNILAVVFSAMFMFFKIIGSPTRGHIGQRHADDVENASPAQHLDDASCNEQNVFRLTAERVARSEKDCADIQYVEHFDAERPARRYICGSPGGI